MKNDVRKPSICMVSPFAEGTLYSGSGAAAGGAERQFSLIGRSLSDQGWEVHFVIGEGRGEGTKADPRITIHRVPFRYLGGPKRHYLPDTWKLIRTIKHTRADILALRSGGPFILAGLVLLRIMTHGKLVIWLQSDHDIDPEIYYPQEKTYIARLPKRIYTLGLRFTDLLISQTKRQGDMASRITGKKTVVMKNMAGDPWGGRGTQKDIGRPDDGYVLWAGNTLPNKRMELALSIADLLPGIRFIIAANQMDEETLTITAREASKKKNVQIIGTVPPEQMERWFDGAGLLLNTSLAEGFPNTFLQAWSRGIPVVTAGVDPDGVISEHGLGAVVPVPQGREGSAAALAEKVKSLVLDKNAREVIRSRVLTYIRENHSPERIGAELSRELQKLLI